MFWRITGNHKTMQTAAKAARKHGHGWLAVDSAPHNTVNEQVIFWYASVPLRNDRFWHQQGPSKYIGIYTGKDDWKDTLTEI